MAAQAPVVCFLDESATDATDSDHAVLGGIVINRRDIAEFDAAWTAMRLAHNVSGPVHMIALGPSGPYPDLVGDKCSAMLADAVSILNRYRVFTVGASMSNRAYEAKVSDNVRKRFQSVYGVAFLMLVEIIRKSAEVHNARTTIDYVLDKGNQYRSHVANSHASIEADGRASYFHMGGLVFESDTIYPALQAADIISWSTRRRRAGKPLVKVHEPLNGLFDDFYLGSELPETVLLALAESFSKIESGP